jgi:uncharacterized protein
MNTEYNSKLASVLKSRTGLIIQVIIVLLPASLVLKSGKLLLAGEAISILLAWLALKLRNEKWSGLGLSKPESFKRVCMIAIASTVALIIFSFFLRHLVTSLTGEKPNLEAFRTVKGNLPALLGGIAVAWIFGAFGEELLFRGFLLNTLSGIFKDSVSLKIRWGLSLFITSVIVSISHSYQGITGMILTGVIGFCFGLIYLFSKKNLWPNILAHGLYDTFAFTLLFAGFSFDRFFR